MPEGFRHVPFNDIDALDLAVDNAVAAVLIEPVQGEGGVLPANVEYLQAAQKMCTERGVLLMLDEVQTGFGRTGKWFGFEHYGISPDVVLMAKAMGNGMPIGAMWAKRSVAEVFKPGDHGSTFSGTAIATSAAKATIIEMQRIDAPRLATEKGALLTQLVSKLDNVSSVRGLGLLLGVELAPGIDAKLVQLSLLELGLVTNAVTASALRLAPPITVTTDEIHEAVSMIASALKGYSS
jgi:acetylornithine/succinyldiaminopimelate/putrescine aminotransferase